MRRAGKHRLGVVLVSGRHADDALAAAALRLIGVRRLPLDIAERGHRQHGRLLGDEILNVDLAGNGGNVGAALVAVFIPHLEALGLHDLQHLVLVGENILQLRNARMQRGELILNFLPFETRQLTETHLHDRLRLHLVEVEPLHELCFRLGRVGGAADDVHHLVDEVHRRVQRLPDVRLFLRLFEIEKAAAGDDLLLELDVFLQNLLERQHARHAVDQTQKDCAEGRLHFGEGIELVEHDLRHRVLFEVDDDAQSLAARMIHHIADALHPLVVHKVDDGFDEL